MKSFKSIILILVLVICLTGCSLGGTKTMTCTRTATQGSMKLDVDYKVTYSGKYVKTVESVEKIISSNKTVLDTYKKTVENIYAPYNDLEYYDAEVTVDGDTLISKVVIDYEKIDTDKLVKIDSAIGNILKNGKIRIEDMKAIYEKNGATCTQE